MRFLVWTCRVILAIAIGAFVATVFYLTHSVDMPEVARAVLNWTTVVATALVGFIWPLIRGYGQALLLLVGLTAARVLFGTDPGLSSLNIPLLTPFQSDFLWVSIGVTFLTLVVTVVARAIVSERHMRAIKQQQAAAVATSQGVGAATAAAIQEPASLAEPAPQVPETPETPETVAPPAEPQAEPAAETEASVTEELPAAEEATKKK